MPKFALLHARERYVWAFAALFAATAMLMLLKPYFTNASEPVRGLRDPVLALQMARSVDDIERILADAPSPDREVMRIKQYEDFAFIAAYLGLLLSMSKILARKWRILSWVLALTGMAIGTLDVCENLAILRVVNTSLDQTSQGMVDLIRAFSVPKWALAALALGLLTAPFLTATRWYLRAAAALNAAAGLAILLGLVRNPFLPWGAFLMILAILWSAGTLKLLTHESVTRDHLPRSLRQN